MTAEVGGAPLVADRPRRLHRERGGALDQLGRDGLALQRLLRRRGPDGRRRHRGEGDPRLRADPVRQRELGRDSDDGDVELPPGRVAPVVAAAARRPGRARRSRRSSSSGASTVRRTPTKNEASGTRRRPSGPGDHRLGVQGQERRRHVGRRRGVAEIAAERRQVPDLDRSDQRRRSRRSRGRPPGRAGSRSSVRAVTAAPIRRPAPSARRELPELADPGQVDHAAGSQHGRSSSGGEGPSRRPPAWRPARARPASGRTPPRSSASRGQTVARVSPWGMPSRRSTPPT